MADKKKEYNKKYYESKKAVILTKLAEKVECPLCKRKVAHQNLKTHQSSGVCKSRRVTEIPDIKRLEEKIKRLTELIEAKGI